MSDAPLLPLAAQTQKEPLDVAAIRARLKRLTVISYENLRGTDTLDLMGDVRALLAELDAALTVGAERGPQEPPNIVEGYDAKFWNESYKLLREAILSELPEDCIHDDDVAEEAILVEAIETAGKRLKALAERGPSQPPDLSKEDIGFGPGIGVRMWHCRSCGKGHLEKANAKSCCELEAAGVPSPPPESESNTLKPSNTD